MTWASAVRAPARAHVLGAPEEGLPRVPNLLIQASAAAPTVEGQERRHMTKGILVTLDPKSAARRLAIERQEELARQRAAARWQPVEQTMSTPALIQAGREIRVPGHAEEVGIVRELCRRLEAQPGWDTFYRAAHTVGGVVDSLRVATMAVHGVGSVTWPGKRVAS